MFIFSNIVKYRHCVNFRAEYALYNTVNQPSSFLEPAKGFLIQIEDCLQDQNCKLKNLVSADDIAAPLLLWLGYYLESPGKKLPQNSLQFRDPSNHPLATKVIYHLFHILFIILLCIFGKNALGSFATILASLSLSFFENFFFISFSYDVYMFPIYTIFLSLIFFNTSRHSCLLFSVCAFLAGLSSWFRSNSSLNFNFIALISLVTLLSQGNVKHIKSQMAKITLAIIICFCSSQIPRLFFSTGKHPIWHSLHAGMFEHGGFYYGDGKFIPRHLASAIKPDEKPVHEFYSWSDQIQYIVVNKKLGKTVPVGSVDYEEVLKEEYLRWWVNNFESNLIFYLKRIPTIYSINPFKPHENNEMFESPYSTESYNASILFSLIFGLFSWIFFTSIRISKFEKLFFGSLLLVNSLSGALVHPGLVIYNAPLLFTQWLMIYTLISRTNFFTSNNKHDVK